LNFSREKSGERREEQPLSSSFVARSRRPERSERAARGRELVLRNAGERPQIDKGRIVF